MTFGQKVIDLKDRLPIADIQPRDPVDCRQGTHGLSAHGRQVLSDGATSCAMGQSTNENTYQGDRYGRQRCNAGSFPRHRHSFGYYTPESLQLAAATSLPTLSRAVASAGPLQSAMLRNNGRS